MVKVTYLPLFVTLLFRGMPGMWKNRHRLMLCWLVVMHALFPGRKTLAELARWTPAQVTAWRWRRLLKASYWDVHLLIEWWFQEAMQTLPSPADGILYIAGDGSDKPKRGKKNPLAQKGRKSQHKPWFFGIRFALLSVNWETYRLPAAFRLIRPKSHPAYQKENEWFREMLTQFNPPSWAKVVVVEGDAAYGSQENMKMVMQRDGDDPERQWGYVFAIARTWKTVEDKAIKDFVTHLPRKHYKRTWVPRLSGSPGHKTFWIYSKRLCLRHIGEVTVVLSKKGRNVGPKNTKILVTNLADLLPRDVVFAYQRRWPIEFNFRDAQQHWGLKDFMVVNKTPVYNSANLSMFMVNVSQALMRPMRSQWPELSVNDLKTWFRSQKYVVETLKLLPEMPEAILIDQVIAQVAQLGRINPAVNPA